MSQTTDDITDGIRCMKCLSLLVADDGTICDLDAPCFCEDCWKALPKRDRDEGAPYWNPRIGEVCSGN